MRKCLAYEDNNIHDNGLKSSNAFEVKIYSSKSGLPYLCQLVSLTSFKFYLQQAAPLTRTVQWTLDLTKNRANLVQNSITPVC